MFTYDTQQRAKKMYEEQKAEAAKATEANDTMTLEQAKLFAQAGRNWLVEKSVLPATAPHPLSGWKFEQEWSRMTAEERHALKHAVVSPNRASIEAVLRLCGSTLEAVREKQFKSADVAKARARVGL